MSKVHRILVVRVAGKKIEIPDAESIIVALRNSQKQQVQASMDITEENINAIRRTIRRPV